MRLIISFSAVHVTISWGERKRTESISQVCDLSARTRLVPARSDQHEPCQFINSSGHPNNFVFTDLPALKKVMSGATWYVREEQEEEEVEEPGSRTGITMSPGIPRAAKRTSCCIWAPTCHNVRVFVID